MPLYLSAQEACQRLNIKEATLYAYVSRGLIRSQVENQSSRKRAYLAEDVDKLVERKAQRRDPAKVVEDALHWGVPLLDSAITLITDNQLYFRGYNAAALAAEHTLEDVAALIWLDDMQASSRLFEPVTLSSAGTGVPDSPTLPPMQALQVAVTHASLQDYAAYDLSGQAVAHTGARILHLMTAVLANCDTLQPTIAGTLAHVWCPGQAQLLNAALVLCADHELNASSFAARIAASVEANPYAVVSAGLAVLQGFKHGGYTARVIAFLRELGQVQDVRAGLAERLRRGEQLPGFGHHLYPDGDPRATALLALLEADFATAAPVRLARQTAAAVQDMTGKRPTIDFALATLERTLSLPDGTALALFALGRTVGWIGQAIEQYASPDIIRPRARYTGRPPQV